MGRAWIALVWALAGIVVLPVGASAALKPDLVVRSLSSDAQADGGSTLTTAIKVKNVGKRTAKPSGTDLFLSQDETFDEGDRHLDGTLAVPKLKPKKSFKDSAFVVGVPVSVPVGAYHLVACADSGDVVREKKESNNCRTVSGFVSINDVTAPNSPGITGFTTPANDNTPTFTGTVEPFAKVQLFGESCTGLVITEATADENGIWAITTNVADDSVTVFSFKARDAASNYSGCTSNFTYVEDSSTATPTNLATSPVSPADNGFPSVNGNAEDGATVTIYKSAMCAGGTEADTVTAAGGGFNVGIAVTSGATTPLTAKAVDPVGNVSGCSSPISYQEVNPITESEPNNVSATANPLGGEFAKGAISSSVDIDFYSVFVPAGSPDLVAETSNPTNNSCTFAFEDTSLRLYAPDGTTILAQDDDDGNGACSLISGTGSDPAASNLTTGTFFVAVAHSFSGTIADYRLRVQLIP